MNFSAFSPFFYLLGRKTVRRLKNRLANKKKIKGSKNTFDPIVIESIFESIGFLVGFPLEKPTIAFARST